MLPANPCTICLVYSCAQLLDTKAVGVRREKMYRIDDHIACAVAGITGAWRAAPSLACLRELLLPAHAWPIPRAAYRRAPAPCPCFCPAADANILLNICRLAAQRYLYAYQERMPVEQLVRAVCDTKQVRMRARVCVGGAHG